LGAMLGCQVLPEALQHPLAALEPSSGVGEGPQLSPSVQPMIRTEI
jgi:hypothetical protein